MDAVEWESFIGENEGVPGNVAVPRHELASRVEACGARFDGQRFAATRYSMKNEGPVPPNKDRVAVVGCRHDLPETAERRAPRSQCGRELAQLAFLFQSSDCP